MSASRPPRPDPSPIPPPIDPPFFTDEVLANAMRNQWRLILDFEEKVGLPQAKVWPETIAGVQRELLTLAGHIAATSDTIGAKEFLKAWPHYVGLCLLGEGQRRAMRLAFGRAWPGWVKP